MGKRATAAAGHGASVAQRRAPARPARSASAAAAESQIEHIHVARSTTSSRRVEVHMKSGQMHRAVLSGVTRDMGRREIEAAALRQLGMEDQHAAYLREKAGGRAGRRAEKATTAAPARERGSLGEVRPGSPLQKVADVNPALFAPGVPSDARLVEAMRSMYGEHQLGAALSRYPLSELRQMAQSAGIQGGRSKEEAVSRLTSHFTQGRYSADFGAHSKSTGATRKTITKAAETPRSTPRARLSPEERTARRTAADQKAQERAARQQRKANDAVLRSKLKAAKAERAPLTRSTAYQRLVESSKRQEAARLTAEPQIARARDAAQAATRAQHDSLIKALGLTRRDDSPALRAAMGRWADLHNQQAVLIDHLAQRRNDYQNLVSNLRAQRAAGYDRSAQAKVMGARFMRGQGAKLLRENQRMVADSQRRLNSTQKQLARTQDLITKQARSILDTVTRQRGAGQGNQRGGTPRGQGPHGQNPQAPHGMGWRELFHLLRSAYETVRHRIETTNAHSSMGGRR